MKNKFPICLIALCCLLVGCSVPQDHKVVYLMDYLPENFDKNSPVEASYALRQAMDECIRLGAVRLVLPGGTLKISPEYAYERYEYISNNDPSMKRIAFLLEDLDQFEIEGNGTNLLFSGFVSAFSLIDCKDVAVKDLAIDYERPFVSEGTITALGPGWYELQFPSYYRVDAEERRLRFRNEDGVVYPYSSLLEFDSQKREVAYHVHDYWIWGDSIPAEKVGEQRFRIYRDDFGEGTIGNVMVFGASGRYHPAFTLLDCENFKLKNVQIYNCCGMGVIAQSSKNIELDQVTVDTPGGSDRMISISADATHFVNCKGYIKLIDCIFRNQKDDATNIHGWYMSVDQILSKDKLLLAWRNSGQRGVRFLQPGMELELVDNESLVTYSKRTVKEVNYLNNRYAEVTFTESLPEEVKEKHVVAEDEAYPDVLIKGCYIGNNRARGLLLGSRGKIIVENCTFHTPGAAILFEGDGNYWFEQSGVREVIIRDNVFDNCMYGSPTWGNACIAVGSGIPQKEGSRYHRNILVENNVFNFFDHRIVNLYCVDGFVFRNNRLVKTDAYPASGNPDQQFVIEECDHVTIE